MKVTDIKFSTTQKTVIENYDNMEVWWVRTSPMVLRRSTFIHDFLFIYKL